MSICRVLPISLVVALAVPAANVAFEADRWQRSNDATVISDMSLVKPKASLSNLRKRALAP